MSDFIPCTLKQLPPELLVQAAEHAIDVNPANRPRVERLPSMAQGLTITPERLAMLATRWWGAGGVHLTVAFLDTNDQQLIQRILSHANAWSQWANVEFTLAQGRQADVRISRQRGGGYWSYLGTDIRQIPANQPTMNLDSFSMDTPESEYKRVVRHEVGHTLGFVHEHLRRDIVEDLDPQKTIAYFMRTQGWSAQEVQQQVLTPIDEALLKATPAPSDRLSVMCYQLSGEITRSGKPIPGGTDIDPADQELAAKLYPKQAGPTGPTGPTPPTPPAPPTATGNVALHATLPPGWYALLRRPQQGPRTALQVLSGATAGSYARSGDLPGGGEPGGGGGGGGAGGGRPGPGRPRPGPGGGGRRRGQESEEEPPYLDLGDLEDEGQRE